jgi:DNA relaxase NicK
VFSAKWDWYEATFDELDDDRVGPALALALGGTLVRGKGRNGYATCWHVERDEQVLAQVYGRSARLGEVHVTITGESCEEVVPVLRSLYPDHRVSRADTAVDFAADFDQLDVQMLAFAREGKLSHRLMTNSDGGATRYIGATSSEVMGRLYKKSEQLRALHPERAAEIPDGIVRFELRIRPGKRQVKEQMATMSPEDAWGMSEWSTRLASVVLGIEAERVSTHFRRPSDWARALHFFKLQYGPMVQRRAAQVGAAQAELELLEAMGLR